MRCAQCMFRAPVWEGKERIYCVCQTLTASIRLNRIWMDAWMRIRRNPPKKKKTPTYTSIGKSSENSARLDQQFVRVSMRIIKTIYNHYYFSGHLFLPGAFVFVVVFFHHPAWWWTDGQRIHTHECTHSHKYGYAKCDLQREFETSNKTCDARTPLWTCSAHHTHKHTNENGKKKCIVNYIQIGSALNKSYNEMVW